MNNFGIIESGYADIVKSVSAKDNQPDNMVEAGYIAKYTRDGKIELATQANTDSAIKIAGVVCGISGQKNHTGLCTQSVVCSSSRVSVVYKGSNDLDVATIMYLETDGSVTNIKPTFVSPLDGTEIIVGVVSAPSLGGSGIAYIKLDNQ